ncbi:hypothetical protein VKT23_010045 [Stygiomarasmius scandens]|uniref:DUF6532 domain-containing protein n=1 Tax=Marasmiellus scandens TaxID=2682957 RepID=A0ABR1JDV4_9AGAR
MEKNKGMFASSIKTGEKSKELELPKALIALATAAIHAILRDYAKYAKEEFPTKELDDIWSTAFQILDNIQKVNESRYHRFLYRHLIIRRIGLSVSRFVQPASLRNY